MKTLWQLLTYPWTYVINDLNNEEIIEIFYEKNKTKSKSTTI